MNSAEYLLLIGGMSLVTYLPRWLPLHWLSRRRLHPWLVAWLDLIPPAILSALLVPELITDGLPRQVVWGGPELLAAIPATVFAVWTRSLGGTVVVGMLSYWLLGLRA
jgi:branched-subunit amino acid transport protein